MFLTMVPVPVPEYYNMPSTGTDTDTYDDTYKNS
jgi:hypothetical protein